MSKTRTIQVGVLSALIAVTLFIVLTSSIDSYVSANFLPEPAAMNDIEMQDLKQELEYFIGDQVEKDIDVKKHPKGYYFTDFETIQGYHRFIIERENEEWIITNAFRM